jgi:hypothetical protein
MRRLLLTLALTAGLVGCGGDDALSTDEYRSELRKICQESNKKTEGVSEPTRATPEAIADYLSRLRDINADTIEQVSDLKPPEELKEAHDRALRVNREGREQIQAVIDKLEDGGDPTQVLSESRDELEKAGKATTQAARDVGVPECGD